MISKNKMLLDTGKYSDLTIICGDKKFKVHRSSVCVQSKPIAVMVDTGALVSAASFLLW